MRLLNFRIAIMARILNFRITILNRIMKFRIRVRAQKTGHADALGRGDEIGLLILLGVGGWYLSVP